MTPKKKKTKSVKNPVMSEEESLQRALGTLPKFEVSVKRKYTTEAFARVYVTALNEEAAQLRATQMIANDDVDDTTQKIEWAENQERKTSKPVVQKVRTLAEDDPSAYRFNKSDDEPGEESVSPDELGQTM